MGYEQSGNLSQRIRVANVRKPGSRRQYKNATVPGQTGGRIGLLQCGVIRVSHCRILDKFALYKRQDEKEGKGAKIRRGGGVVNQGGVRTSPKINAGAWVLRDHSVGIRSG